VDLQQVDISRNNTDNSKPVYVSNTFAVRLVDPAYVSVFMSVNSCICLGVFGNVVRIFIEIKICIRDILLKCIPAFKEKISIILLT
jgi:hypothetical protein